MAELKLARQLDPDLDEIDLAMMRRAMELARVAASMAEVPVGAVVYRGTEIIAEAANTRESSRDPVGHAELLAVSAAGRRLSEWRLSDCSIAVTLEPCPMCAGALVNARMGRLIYGAADPKGGAVRSLYALADDGRLNHQVKVISGLFAEPCGRMLTEFFRARRAARRAARSERIRGCA
ncbi:MAG: tRNA adenosine(34) deaminase TadA [Phycisphaerales bacterium]|nr:tRNA adenosine(34) deaminase TadA [Phycisphaerales bacterium]